jgi:TPR repeat protein
VLITGGAFLAWNEQERRRGGRFDVFAASSVRLSQEELDGLKALESKAFSGDPEAAYDYAVLLYRGEFVEKDVAKAIKFFEVASAGGVKEASYNLGLLYVSGQRVARKDVKKGMEYLEKAASLNCKEACFKLGLMHFHGQEGLSVNSEKAFAYMKSAAELEMAEAAFMCGLMAQTGRGTPQNSDSALTWFTRAGALGHPAGACNAAMMYHNGIGTPTDMFQAWQWYEISSKLGDQDGKATHALFLLYGLRDVVDKDIPMAVQLLQESKEHSAIAQRALASIYLARGEIQGQEELSKLLPPNKTAAYELFASCARLDDNDCRSELASMILKGEGVAQKHADSTLAFKLVSKAAEEGHSNAYLKKGIMQSLGIGTNVNPEAAAKSYLKASEKRNFPAMFLLGMAYIEGEGVEKSYTKAMTFLSSAEAGGYQPAIEAIKILKDDRKPDYWRELREKLLQEPEKPFTL